MRTEAAHKMYELLGTHGYRTFSKTEISNFLWQSSAGLRASSAGSASSVSGLGTMSNMPCSEAN